MCVGSVGSVGLAVGMGVGMGVGGIGEECRFFFQGKVERGCPTEATAYRCRYRV